ncbi:MAG TPA: ComF family protein [Abditibacterium sp.]|jgi:ComF family protein
MKAPIPPIRSFQNHIWQSLLDALFPPRCAACLGWSRTVFCESCAPKLRPIDAPQCQKCGVPFDPLAFAAAECALCRQKAPHFEAARAAFHFDGPIRDAIHRLKYHEKSALAARLAPFLAQLLGSDAMLRDFAPDFLVAVPLHPRRLRNRGFNQSQLLALELSRQCKIPLAAPLRRTRNTTPQVELKGDERAKNVRGAFEIDATIWAQIGGKNARFLLIDDVITTGSTLGEAALVLKKAGADGVCALTLAR